MFLTNKSGTIAGSIGLLMLLGACSTTTKEPEVKEPKVVVEAREAAANAVDSELTVVADDAQPVEAEAAVTTGAEPSGPRQITTAEDFNASIVGKTFRSGEFSGRVRANGTVDGKRVSSSSGNRVFATWEWRDGFYCRTKVRKKSGPKDQCFLVKIDGDQAFFIADKGTGSRTQWTLR